MGLTTKQELFVSAYCSNGFNATQAAIEAGYSEKWNRYGDIEMRQSGDGVTFLIHSNPDELQVLRAELIGSMKGD